MRINLSTLWDKNKTYQEIEDAWGDTAIALGTGIPMLLQAIILISGFKFLFDKTKLDVFWWCYTASGSSLFLIVFGFFMHKFWIIVFSETNKWRWFGNALITLFVSLCGLAATFWISEEEAKFLLLHFDVLL